MIDLGILATYYDTGGGHDWEHGDFTGDGTNPACADPLVPTATCVLTVTYVVTQADVDAGQIDNLGTVEGTDPKKDDKTLKRKPDTKEPFCGLVFKILPAKTGDNYWIRIYSGQLKQNSRVQCPNRDKKENIAQLWQIHATKKDRDGQIDSVETIVGRVEQALQYLAAERITLNPDCGFACFASRGVNVEEVAEAKLASMAVVATCRPGTEPGELEKRIGDHLADFLVRVAGDRRDVLDLLLVVADLAAPAVEFLDVSR